MAGNPLIGSSDPNARRNVAQAGGVTNVGWPCPRHLRVHLVSGTPTSVNRWVEGTPPSSSATVA